MQGEAPVPPPCDRNSLPVNMPQATKTSVSYKAGARARQEQVTSLSCKRSAEQEWPGLRWHREPQRQTLQASVVRHVDHVKMQQRPLMAAYERKNTMRKEALEEYHHKLFKVVQNLEEKFTKVEEDFFETNVKLRKLKWQR